MMMIIMFSHLSRGLEITILAKLHTSKGCRIFLTIVKTTTSRDRSSSICGNCATCVQVKTTSPDAYLVVPHRGVLEPGEVVNITIKQIIGKLIYRARRKVSP